MRRALTVILIVLLAGVVSSAQSRRRPIIGEAATITIRAAALAQMVDRIAGFPVIVPGTRLVWVIDSRAVVVESDPRGLEPLPGGRHRVLVLVGGRRSLIVPRAPVMDTPVTIRGVARTLLGVQVGHDVPWPAALTTNLIDRLEIRAAIVADSVETPDGVELTTADTSLDSSQ
jgi:hypothetical protein